MVEFCCFYGGSIYFFISKRWKVIFMPKVGMDLLEGLFIEPMVTKLLYVEGSSEHNLWQHWWSKAVCW
jgi:hypothetical protein